MNTFRFYCELLTETMVELDAGESRHLASVLRITKGQKVELFDGNGKLAIAVVESANSKRTSLKIEQVQNIPKSTKPKIIIAASMAKGERFNWLISKCTELGVDRICPVLFEHTVKQAKNPKAVERWRNLCISAAKQCRRNFLPEIDKPTTLPQVLKEFKNDYPQADILVGGLDKDCLSLTQIETISKDTIAFIGPEGGLTEDEKKLLNESNAKAVRLTDTVLRIETAAVTFASILTAQRDR